MTENISRGFITIAVGDYYRYLAKYLAITYRMNANNEYPLAIVTEKTNDEIDNLYDEVIITKDDIRDGYLYKLKLFDYSPFSETIFIDADSYIIRNIDFLWEMFKDQDFGVLGINSKSVSGARNFFNLQKIMREYGINEVPKFSGGVYYFKKNKRAKKVFDDAQSLTSRYDYFEMPRFQNAAVKNAAMGDEPLISLAMAINRCRAIEDKNRIGMYNLNKSINLKIDVLKNECNYYKSNKYTTPSIVHFGTDRTKMYHYRKEMVKLYLVYNLKTNKNIAGLLIYPYTIWYLTIVMFSRIVTFNFKQLLDYAPTYNPVFNIKRKIHRKLLKLVNPS